MDVAYVTKTIVKVNGSYYKNSVDEKKTVFMKREKIVNNETTEEEFSEIVELSSNANPMERQGNLDSKKITECKKANTKENGMSNHSESKEAKHEVHEKNPLHLRLQRPKILQNLVSGEESYDSHCLNAFVQPIACTERLCLGSTINHIVKKADAARANDEILEHAKDFLDKYFASIRRENTPAHEKRWQIVQSEVASSGTYQLTETELVFGAKLAWRNAARCIGRIQWSKLQVFDCRYVTTTSGMFEALCNHIKYGTNKGNIRSAITIFPQRTDAKHDYRIWNSQLISYAGYKNPDGTILGDPLHCEFTELCIKLGWKPPRTAWDILPLVLSANGKDPDYFEIPKEYIMEVQLSHPNFDWFEKLGLRWYVLPAVSNMRFDCGGIEFTAAAFNGWYMSSEIGCRNLCDTSRRNLLEVVAKKMGLDTRVPTTLWKDRALVEVNVSVLHSFQLANATIVDHHTASDSFMKHLDNENRLRSGCPADWVWIVPPISGSITPVFHQEMALYYLRPSYELQEPAWKTHQWHQGTSNKKPINRKFHFKQIARAVKFTSKLFGRALSRRIKATVLYATETGKSEAYAKKLGLIFGHAFNAQVHCMEDYDISSIEHEALILVVTSTFGNGDPPENGETFAQALYSMKMAEQAYGDDFSGSVQLPTPKSFIKANSQVEFVRSTSNNARKLDRIESLKGGLGDSSIDNFGPLSNVRFAVFALGSSAYPNFADFGKYVDKLLVELGGERILDLATGDEMCGQEQAFNSWAKNIFQVACETFCLDDDATLLAATDSLGADLTEETVRFVKYDAAFPSLLPCLNKAFNKSLLSCKTVKIEGLGEGGERSTIFVELQHQDALEYEPGDHVGVVACNREELVNAVLARLSDATDPDAVCELQCMKETHTSNGTLTSWVPHERIPPLSIREILTRCVDLTTAPTPNVLLYLANTACNEKEKQELMHIATDPSAYEDWRHYRFPTLAEVLEQFPTTKPRAALLLALLSPLQPRFYSISSSPLAHPKRLHLTVAVVTYTTQDGKGPLHYGVCSNYLKSRKPGDEVFLFIRSAPNFHLPPSPSSPIILVGPGTGIAPFRGFWHHRRVTGRTNSAAWLFFGCRNHKVDLYRDEKQIAVKEGYLDKVFLALSREKNIPKTYVQELLEKEGADIYKLLVQQNGHFYVCGDVKMAEDVQQKLRGIIKKHGKMTDEQVLNFMFNLRDENRYHEDIFGITLRTAEVHNASRQNARLRLKSGTQP